MSDALFPEDPADTREQILEATHEALSAYGYADLTIDRIDEFFPKSKSLLYHHYDGKDDVVLDYLAYLLGTVEAGLDLPTDADAETRLKTLLHRAVVPPDDADEGLDRAMVELRAQGATDPDFRQHFTDHDEFFRDRIADIVDAGVEEGTFRAVDSRQVAAMLHALVGGTMVQRATSNRAEAERIRDEIDEYIEDRLVGDES